MAADALLDGVRGQSPLTTRAFVSVSGAGGCRTRMRRGLPGGEFGDQGVEFVWLDGVNVDQPAYPEWAERRVGLEH